MHPRFQYDRNPILNLNKIQLESKSRIEKKINNDEYVFESVNCIVCGSDSFEKISEKDRYGLYQSVVICEKCGLVQTNPRMSQSSYNEFYNDEYRPLYVGYDTPTNIFFERQYNKANLIFDFIKQNIEIPKDKAILEVGCGAGGILKYFKDIGYDVFGCDLGEEYINYGNENYDLNLQACALENFKLPEDKQVGLVIYSHVMEHILNPYKELQSLKEFIDKDTVLYIEVPGIKNIHNNYEYDLIKYLQNAHTYHFSKTSLTNLLNKSGYEVIKADEYVRSVSKLKSEIKNEIINDYNNVKEYLDKTEKNRFRALLKPGYYKLRIKTFLIKTLEKLNLRNTVRKLRKK